MIQKKKKKFAIQIWKNREIIANIPKIKLQKLFWVCFTRKKKFGGMTSSQENMYR